MNQGILLLAHKNISHLKRIINFFDDDFCFYIHIDKKTSLSENEMEEIRNHKNVEFLVKELNVNWGGVNMLGSLLLLSKEAVKNKNIEYFHSLSGQDFPIKSCNEIKELLISNKGKEYMQNFEIPVKGRDWGKDSGMDRLWYYHFNGVFNARTISGKIVTRVLLEGQKILNMKQEIQPEIPKLFGGEMWWTLSYPCLKYVVDYTRDQPFFLNRLKYSLIPEEIYFQTIIMNSSFKENVVDNPLRYINWSNRNGNKPANLDETDYNNIIKSDAIFARKFEYPVSKNLIDKIENHLYSNPKSFSQLFLENDLGLL